MKSNFWIERQWFGAQEVSGTTDERSFLLSMTDGYGRGTFVEWSGNESRKRTRKLVLPGDTWILERGQTFWTRPEADKTCIQLGLACEWFRQVTDGVDDLRPHTQLRDLLLNHMLRGLADTTNMLPHNPTSALYQESLATSVALHLATHYGGAAPKRASERNSGAPLSSERMRVLSEYIAEHLGETIALADLVQLVGLSASQFSLRFRETTGQTPHQFVVNMRVERARELIVAGRYNLADVAARTGFADQSHLTRHVRRALGVTPGELRRG